MGIQGLLPLLKSIHQPVEPRDYRGQTVAVDTYCWLHKGVYACAYDLQLGRQTTVYVNYIIKRLKVLLYHNVVPIMVFDGRNLPTKAEKEKERRESRAKAKEAGLQHMSKGEQGKATECFQRCIDITPDMALEVIKACHEMGVQCIVAPYEADAQLAYMQQAGIVDMVITEDSDLLAYGCTKVLFKMDAFGCGTLIDSSQFGDVSSIDLSSFTVDDFRHMCILSGCDYLSSVNGVGLQTAAKLLKRCNKDPSKVISHLRLDCSKRVPIDYEKRFWLAEYTFLHQVVYDPESKQTCHLKPISSDVKELCNDWTFVGTNNDPSKAALIASGALSLDGKRETGFDPSKPPVRSQKFPTAKAEAPVAITALLPKAAKPVPGKARHGQQQRQQQQQITKSATKPAKGQQQLTCFRAQSFTYGRTKEQVTVMEPALDQSVLLSYGVEKTVASASFSSESVLVQRSPHVAAPHPVKRRASPLRDSLGEQVLSDEEESLYSADSYSYSNSQVTSMVDSEEPLSDSYNQRQQPLAPPPSQSLPSKRVSKFFANNSVQSPSSNNTLSAMLRQAEQKQCENTTAINLYVPPVTATRPRPLIQSNSSSLNSVRGVAAIIEKQEKRTSLSSPGLSMFSYASKRRSSESSNQSDSVEHHSTQISASRGSSQAPPAAKLPRLSTSRGTGSEEDESIVIDDNDDCGGVADSGLSPIVSGSAQSFSATAKDLDVMLRATENIPPEARRPSVGVSKPPHQTMLSPKLAHRPTPGKKLLATLSKARRSSGGTGSTTKRLGVGRPSLASSQPTNTDIRGFMPGCFDQFRRKPRAITRINVDDSDDEDPTATTTSGDTESPNPLAISA